jgi:hypothetical protein
MDMRDYRNNIYVCGVRTDGRIDHFMMPKGTVNSVALEPYSFAYNEETRDILKSSTLQYKGTRRKFELDRAMELAYEMVETLEAMRDGKNFVGAYEVL